MTLDTLRFQQWHYKNQLSVSSYATLTSAVVKVLYDVLSHPYPPDAAWSQAFVHSYVQDSALHLLQNLDVRHTDESCTVNEVTIRKQILQLATVLATKQSGLADLSTLVDLAVVYGEMNSQCLKDIYLKTFQSDHTLLDAFERDVVTSFTKSLGQVSGKAASSRKTIFIVTQLFQCGDAIVQAFLRNADFVKSLVKCYQTASDKLSFVNLGDETRNDWLYVKIGVLDALHVVMESLIQSHAGSNHELLFATLFTVLEMPSSSGPHGIPFISQTLLEDYEYAFSLSEELHNKFGNADDARVDLLIATLKESSKSHSGTKSAAGIAPVLKLGPRTIELPVPNIVKGKGKARAETATNEADVLDLSISQVLDIFPSYTPDYIRRCLKHSMFRGNSEKLISALLEGTLPSELQSPLTNTPLIEPPPREEFRYVKNRQNVWDDAPMDISKLRIGKARDYEGILNDHSFIEQMKADILRRAEELSEDEEDSLGKHGRTAMFFKDDLTDEDAALGENFVNIAAGEASDTDEDVQSVEPSAPETILELAYLQNPKLFDRDSETRRSKARAELKARTGWGDEQIEGWRIMLERNPKKDKVLRKHEFLGNKPLNVEDAIEAGPSSRQDERESGGQSRSGRGRGRGAVREDATRNRAWKDKNKARQANHNRKRGHDKKMARAAPPAG